MSAPDKKNLIENALLYVKARLAETEKRPELHRHVRRVYEHYREVLEQRPDDYIREAGDMFAVAQAEQKDRAENFRDLHVKMDNPEAVRGQEIILKGAASATGHADIYHKIQSARKEADELLKHHHVRRNTIQEFFGVLTQYMRSIPEDKADMARNVKLYWDKLKTLDAGISWEKLWSHRPYRDCLYFSDKHIPLLKQAFQEVVK